MSDGNGKPGGDGPAGALVQVEANLEPAIKDLPATKQQEIRQIVESTFHQTFFGLVRTGAATPSIDAETAKVLTASIDKDNENKFKYLTQKQQDSAAERAREQALESQQHLHVIRPIVWAVILITLASVAAGISFIAMGKEAIGSSILTGVFGAILGFLGGLGTAKISSR